ncbi:hypothetical protein E2R25_09595 [Burkholderia pseudomallei]|nr:hypothetical protein EXY28_09600 [Burkholderia pseudomallei]QBP48508.1 hypothetical protein E2R28_09580 [Burkholderia pseudomallei]QBP68416.1 hypothetical protein E2R25_09595 [Burkholderia pseudomallei]QBR23921.1 hypothetical protein E3O37_09695 [Burkholderia pseudomallei]
MRARRAHRTARAHALRRACRSSGLLSGEGRRDASPPPRRIRDEAPPAVALLPQAPLLERGRGRQCAGRRASSDECVQVASRPKRGDALRRGPTHRYSAAIASV